MLRTSFNFFKSKLALVRSNMEAKIIEPITEVSVAEKRPDDTSIEPNEAKKLKTESKAQSEPKLSKRKYALLIGYCGEGYFGLQRYKKNFKSVLFTRKQKSNNILILRNAKQKTEIKYRTIEDEIVDGLVKINAIPQNHSDDMFKVIVFQTKIT